MNNHHLNQPSLSAAEVAIAGHARDLDIVIAGLSSDLVDVRVAAVSALIRIGQPTIAQMRLLLRDPNTAVQIAAASQVHRSNLGKELVGDLIDLLDSDKSVAEAATFALGEIGDSSPIVIEKLSVLVREHADALCREAAVAALGSLGQGLDVILGALKDVATVRRRAVIALAPFDGPDVDAALQAATSDRDWQVRQAAEDLLTPPL